MEAYSGYYKDETILKNVASGGAASILGEAIIGMGGVVYGAGYTDGYKKVQFYRASTLEELVHLKGSKYVWADKKMSGGGYRTLFEAIADDLINGLTVLLTGLGCDIGSVLSYCESKEIGVDNLYTVDLICQGPTFPEAQASYIDMLEKKYKSKIIFFNVRYKKFGWTPPYVYAKFENGKEFCQKWTESELFYSFARFTRKSCTQCRFKGEKHKSDITIGDFWGLEPNMMGYNENGVSAFLVRTEKGTRLMNYIDKERYSVDHADASFIIKNNPYYNNSRDASENADEFEKNLKAKGLHYAIQKNRGFIKSLYCDIYTLLKGIYR